MISADQPLAWTKDTIRSSVRGSLFSSFRAGMTMLKVVFTAL